MRLVGRHDTDNTGGIGEYSSCKRARPGTGQHIMDLHLPGMSVVVNGATGIDPDMVKAQSSPGILPRHQVPERDPGKLRVRVPWQRFSRDRLAGYDNRVVPAV